MTLELKDEFVRQGDSAMEKTGTFWFFVQSTIFFLKNKINFFDVKNFYFLCEMLECWISLSFLWKQKCKEHGFMTLHK